MDDKLTTPSGRTLESALGEALNDVRAMKRGESTGAVVHEFWAPPEAIDVAAIRRAMGLSQAEFAARYGFSLSGLKKWEAGDRQPESGTRTLLTLIARDHATIDALLTAER